MDSKEQTNTCMLNLEGTTLAKPKTIRMPDAYRVIDTRQYEILLELFNNRMCGLLSTFNYMVRENIAPDKILLVLKSKLDDLQFLLAINNTKDIMANLLSIIYQNQEDESVLSNQRKQTAKLRTKISNKYPAL